MDQGLTIRVRKEGAGAAAKLVITVDHPDAKYAGEYFNQPLALVKSLTIRGTGDSETVDITNDVSNLLKPIQGSAGDDNLILRKIVALPVPRNTVITFVGGDGTDMVSFVDEVGDAIQYVVTAGTLELDSGETIAFAQTEALSIAAGASADLISLSGVDPAMDIDLDGGGNRDRVVVDQGLVSTPEVTFLNLEVLDITNGQLTLGISQFFDEFHQSGGSLTGSADLTVNTLGQWTAGIMSGTGKTVVASAAEFDITGPATKALVDRMIVNAGDLIWGEGVIAGGTGTIHNLSGAYFAGQGYHHGFESNDGYLDIAGSNTPGVVSIGRSFTQTSTATLDIELGGTAGASDQLIVGETVHLAGTLTLGALDTFASSPAYSYVLINNLGSNPVVGTFAGRPEGSVVIQGSKPYMLSYKGGNGNDVVLTDLTLSITDLSFSEGNAGTTNAVFTVTLSTPSPVSVTVDYNTANGTAGASTDYVATSGSLTFAPGETSNTITVPVVGETMYELDENFFVNLSNSVNAGIADNQGVGTILNDDAFPALSISDVSHTEGNNSTSRAVFTVSLSGSSSSTVTVDYNFANGSASPLGDYTPSSGTLTFSPTETSQTIVVPIIGDTKYEFDETFFINLSNPVNADIADGQAVGTILNDDAVPSIVIGDVTKIEGSSGGTLSYDFPVTLSHASQPAVTVNFTTVAGTASSPSDYTAVSGTLTFASGQTAKLISVIGNEDSIEENHETFTMSLSAPVNGTLSDATGLGTIQNDDTSISIMASPDVFVQEGDSGTVTFIFTVTLSHASAQSVSMSYATANNTATAGSDYQAKSGTLTFAPSEISKTIEVTIYGDTTVEATESFFMNLSNAVNASFSSSSAIGTIENDDF